MPCYEVRTMSVEFKAKNEDLLQKALQTLGWRVQRETATQLAVYPKGDYNGFTIDLKAEKVLVREDQQPRVNELKRAYSNEAIKQVAKQNRWMVNFTKPVKGVLTRMY